MLVQKLPFYIDFKHKTMYLYHENNEAEQVSIDNEGAGVLTLDMFKSVDLAALKGFVSELKEIVDVSQMQAILQLWGNSNAIKLSVVCDVLNGDRVLAKNVLRLGITRGVLATGVNSTWKVVNKEEQKTMKEHAEKMKRGTIQGALTYDKSIEMLQKQGFEIGEASIGEKVDKKNSLEVEGGRVSTKVLPKKKQVVEKTIDEGVMPENDSSIEIVPENPEERPDKKQPNAELALRLKLKALEHKAKTFTEWSETVTPWTVNSEIQAVKAQLRTLENNKASKQYKQEVNAAPSQLLPKSITRIEQPAPTKAKILPKKKL